MQTLTRLYLHDRTWFEIIEPGVNELICSTAFPHLKGRICHSPHLAYFLDVFWLGVSVSRPSVVSHNLK